MFRGSASTAAAAAKSGSKPVRQTRKWRQQFEHSAKLAQQLATGSPVEDLDSSALADFAPAIASDNATPSEPRITLETLATYRPTRAPPINAPVERYAKEYARAFGRLDKAFLRPQLRELWDAYVHDRASSASQSDTSGSSEPQSFSLRELGGNAGKRQIVAAFLESWGWPRVETVQREREAAKLAHAVEEKGEFSIRMWENAELRASVSCIQSCSSTAPGSKEDAMREKKLV